MAKNQYGQIRLIKNIQTLHFLQLIRYKNLVFIALIQVFIKYGLLQPFGIDTILNTFHFIVLVLATLCIAAAGNIINDIYDVAIDKINKPSMVLIGKKISEKSANTLFMVFNITGVVLGFYLSNVIGKPSFVAIFIITSALLYMYASYLKSVLVIGNIVISLLVALSVLMVGIFDLLPAITSLNQTTQSTVFSIILDYAMFAFMINLIREIVKDVQDMDGDKNGERNTIPIAIGKSRTTYLIFALGTLSVLLTIAYMYIYLYENQVLMLYFLFLIVAPLLYFCIKSWMAKTKSDFAFLSGLLKVILFLGMCSILLFQFTIH